MSVIVNEEVRKVRVVIQHAKDGKPFKYEDFTPEQLEALKLKFEDLSPEEKLALKGDKGDALTFEDLTPEQVELLEAKVTAENIETALGGKPVKKGELFVNVQDYGAVGDGVTDDRQAFLDAIDIGKTVIIPYTPNGYVATELTINDGQKIIGHGSIIKPQNGTCFRLLSNTEVTGIIIEGTGITGTATNGINIFNQYNNKVHNVTIRNLNGIGYAAEATVGSSQGNIFSNLVVHNCVTGVYYKNRGEYNKLSTGSIYSCTNGLIIKGGNNNISNLTITSNTLGVWLEAGENDAHGVVSNCNINHNTTNIRCDLTAIKAFAFNNCDLYGGNIWLNLCEGIIFNSCAISSAQIREQGAKKCYFKSCNIYVNTTILNNYAGAPSEVYYDEGCNFDFSAIVAPRIIREGSYTQGTLETPQTGLAHGTETNILDNRKLNKLNINEAFTVKQFYDTTVNAFDGAVATSLNKHLIFFNGFVNVYRAGSYIPENDVQVVLKGSINGEVLRGQLVKRYDNGSSIFLNLYRISGFVKRDAETYSLMLKNYSGDTVNVLRNQSGNYICFLDAYGW